MKEIGRTEKYKGNVFVDETNDSLDSLLESLGISREDVDIKIQKCFNGKYNSYSFVYDGVMYYSVYEKVDK